MFFLESSAINDVDGEEASRDLALFWFSKLQVLLQLQMPRCKGGCLKLHLVKCLAAAMHFTLMPSIKIPSASVVTKKKATVISIFNPTEIAHEFPSEDLRRLRLSYFLSIQRKYYQYNLYHGLRCSK